MVGRLLRERREAKGWSQERLAEALGTSQRQITRWEHYVTEMPRESTREVVGRLLGIAPAEWHMAAAASLTADPPPAQTFYYSDAVLLAAIGAEPLPHDEALSIEEFTGSARTGQRNQVPQGFDEQLPRKRKPTGFSGLVRLRVSGSCMVPRLNPGDLVIFDTRRAPEPGQIVLAVLDEHEALIKRLTVRDGQRWLVALDGWEQVVDERVRIVGVAVMVQAALV